MQFTLNAILMLLLGVAFVLGGAYMIFMPYMRLMAVGMVATGIGCIAGGMTDGFTDPTPRGMLFHKLGTAAFIVGVPILIYSGYRML